MRKTQVKNHGYLNKAPCNKFYGVILHLGIQVSHHIHEYIHYLYESLNQSTVHN